MPLHEVLLMTSLSDAGIQLVQNLAQRHDLSTDGVTHMLFAIQNGNGSMAQFNHPEFGGCGQWMRGGMTMVSDLFNNQLKYRVDSICNDIANELGKHQATPFSGSFQSQTQNGVNSQTQAGGGMGSGNNLFAPDPEANWWPQEFGVPNALGAQNQVRYANFSQSHRLAVKTGSDVWVYDTKDHHVSGFSQQQGSGGSITFTSQYGTVDLSTLPVISRNGVMQPIATHAASVPVSFVAGATSQPAFQNTGANSPAVALPGPVAESPSTEDIIETLERLGGLRDKGYVTEEEFATKKAELLSRL